MAKIWVADDDASIRTILEEVLSESFDVTVFADGEALLESLSSSTPDACLLYTSPSPRDRQKSRMPSSA